MSAAFITVPPGLTCPLAAYIYAFVGGLIPRGFDSGILVAFCFGGSTFELIFGGIWSEMSVKTILTINKVYAYIQSLLSISLLSFISKFSSTSSIIEFSEDSD